MGILDEKTGQELKRRIREGMPMPIDSFMFHVEIKSVNETGRLIEGYASTKDLDRVGDVVDPAAFEESLKEYMQNPVVTYMHNWHDPIGKVNDARIDDRGLYVKAQISETAEKVWTLIKEGVLQALSIGYDVLEEKLQGDARVIEKLKLYEIAVVSIPANRHALFSVAKALEKGTDLVCDGCRASEPSIVDLFMKAPQPTTVQSLILSKEVFPTRAEARKWVADHEYRADKIDETEDSWRFRQRNPSDFIEDSFRTITLTKGVKAVIGKLKPEKMVDDEPPAHPYLESPTPKNLALLLTDISDWLNEGSDEVTDQNRATLQNMLKRIESKLHTGGEPEPELFTKEQAEEFEKLTKEVMESITARAAQGAALRDTVTKLVTPLVEEVTR